MLTLDDLLARNEILSVETILKYVDDYSIYSFYIGQELELGGSYSSPFRIDDHPSFSLFEGDRDRIYFKDHATTYKGDVFEFVKIMLEKAHEKRYTFFDVLKQIDIDFNLGLYVISNTNTTIKKILKKPKEQTRLDIGVTSRKIPSKAYQEFWTKYDISEKTLNLYGVTNILIVHYKSPIKQSYYYPKTLGISYRIGDRYKLYYPYETKENKFRNNYPKNWVEGFVQLKYEKSFCVITKSLKEVMFFREHFDWDAIAGKSENTFIPEHLMQGLFEKYSKIYIMLDNDRAGINAQEEYLYKYPELISIIYPNSTLHKDPTDRYAFFKEHKKQQIVLNEIKNLINGRI